METSTGKRLSCPGEDKIDTASCFTDTMEQSQFSFSATFYLKGQVLSLIYNL